MNRRQFLAATAGAVAATRLAAADEPKGQPDVLPIIDTHQHLWDLKQFRLPWIKPDAPLARSFLMDDYLAATAGLNVVKTVYMEVDVDPEQQRAEADYVIDLCKRADNPMVAAVIAGRPASGAFPRSITPFKDSAYVKGVRQVLHGPDTPAGYCLSAEFLRGVRLLGELGLRFDVCVRPGEVGDAVKLVDACPDTRFILDHCGNGEVKAKDRTQWKKDMADLAKRDRVVCKVSGIVAQMTPGKWTPDDLAPVINHTLEVFGPERVLFAGDWPVCTLGATFKQWVEALKVIVRERKAEEQRRLFHDNAVRVYGLG